MTKAIHDHIENTRAQTCYGYVKQPFVEAAAAQPAMSDASPAAVSETGEYCQQFAELEELAATVKRKSK